MDSNKTHNISGLFVDDGGSGGIPIVFLHSLAGNSGQWAVQLAYFRQTRRAVAIDLPGHGRSDANGNLAIEAMAAKVHEVVEELGLERFILVGHSMGGSVAGAYAGAYPDQVVGLFLADPSGDSTQMPVEEAQAYLNALRSPAYTQVIEGYWAQILEGSTAQTKAQVMTDLRHTPPSTVIEASEDLFRTNPMPALKRYDGPIFSLITHLNEFPISLHNLDPDIKYMKLEGTGHWLQMDRPEAFNTVLDEWLKDLE